MSFDFQRPLRIVTTREAFVQQLADDRDVLAAICAQLDDLGILRAVYEQRVEAARRQLVRLRLQEWNDAETRTCPEKNNLPLT
jgi:hypothetical protein